MKKFAITGKNFTGVAFAYYSIETESLLDLQTSQAQLSLSQVNKLFKNIPVLVIELLEWCERVELNVIEVVEKVTFEEWYKDYGVLEGKKKALASWNKLDESEHIKAFLYNRVMRSKKKISGEAMPYPATYLNQQRWND